MLTTLAPGAAYALVGLGDGALVSFGIAPSTDGALALEVNEPTERERGLTAARRPGKEKDAARNDGRGVDRVRDARQAPRVCGARSTGRHLCERRRCAQVRHSRRTQQRAPSWKTNARACSASALRFANVDARDVGAVCALNGGAFRDALCLASASGLAIGRVDDVQRLHIRTYTLDEMPRRIAHAARLNALAVLTVRVDDTLQPARERAFVRLIDDQSFETLDTLELPPNESGLSVIATTLADADDAAAAATAATTTCVCVCLRLFIC